MIQLIFSNTGKVCISFPTIVTKAPSLTFNVRAKQYRYPQATQYRYPQGWNKDRGPLLSQSEAPVPAHFSLISQQD